MNIVLDTNMFCANYLMDGTTFRVFFDGLERIGGQLFVPEVVFAEVINKYAEQLKETRRDIEKGYERLRQFRRPVPPLLVTEAYVEQAIRDYRDFLRSRLEEAAATFPPYPAVTHQDVVERELRRQKPFSDRGAGYRDFLIWRSIIDVVKRHGPVSFITHNQADFGVGKDISALHTDLSDDLVAQGLPRNAVELFRGLDEFVQAKIKPELEFLDVLREIAEGTYEGLDIPSELDQRLYDVLAGTEFSGESLDLHGDTATVNSIQGIEDTKVVDVRRLPSGELLIEVEADVKCEFDDFIYRPDLYMLDEDEMPYVADWDWNEHYVRATGEAVLHLYVHMTFDREAHKVTSLDVVDAGRR